MRRRAGWRCGPVKPGEALAGAVRSAAPGSFAMVMATGIVSTALLRTGSSHLSGLLLIIAVTSLAVLAVASAGRAAAFPADLRDDLTSPDRSFSAFALVAACNVVGDRLAADGHDLAAAALAGVALAAWLALTCLVPARLAVLQRGRSSVLPRGRPAVRLHLRPVISDVGGSWYLWAVSTQSLAIAATFLQAAGLLPVRAAALAAITAWSAGAAIYLAVTAAVAARLLLAGLRPQHATAPFWVAMGAASITALAAAQILGINGSPAVHAARPLITGLAVIFWALATCLIPPLIARSAWRHLRRHAPLSYRAELWMIVFPAGMYATASMQLGAAAGLPLMQRVGTAAAWVAAAAWALTFTAMLVSPLAGRSPRRSPGHKPGVFRNLYRGTINVP